jgi:hypothetical protein
MINAILKLRSLDMRMLFLVLTASVAVGLWVPLVSGADKFNEMLPLVPEEANYLVLIDVQGLHQSPLGMKNDWSRRQIAAFRDGATPYNPMAEEFLFAARLDHSLSKRVWEINLAKWAKILTSEDLKQVKGVEETIAGMPTFLTPRNAYLFVLKNRIAGLQYPADRQKLARWFRWGAQNKQVVMPEYLREAAAAMDKTTQIVVAVDLADKVNPQQLRQGLEKSKALAGKKVDLDGLARLLAEVRGMHLRVRVTEVMDGEFRIEFGQEVKTYEAALSPMLAEALVETDDDLNGLAKWDMRVEGKAVIFRKQLSENDLDGILVKLQPVAVTAAQATPETLDPKNREAAAKQYFQTVTRIVAEMRKQADRATNYIKAAQLHDTAADRIDRLLSFGVDTDLRDYGTSVSSKLRMLAESLRGVPVQVGALQSGKVMFVSAQPGYAGFVPGRFFARPGFGYGAPETQVQGNVAEVQAQQAQVIANDGTNRLSVWRKYDEETAQMRSTLSTRYKSEF